MTNTLFFFSYLQTAYTFFLFQDTSNKFLQAKRLGIIEKLLQKLEVSFLDDVLAVVDVALA